MAVSFASPYKGSGRGFIYTTSSSHSTASSAGLAQAPVVSMGSVSAGMMSSGNSSNNQSSRGINYATIGGLSGIATCATTIRGGVTTRQTAAKMSASAPNKVGVRRSQVFPGGVVSDCECPWDLDEENDKYVCPVCGCEIDMDVILDGDGHFHCDCDPCRCPIEWDWSVWAFLSLLSVAYIAYKKRLKMSNFA